MSTFSKADAKGIVDVFYIVAWRRTTESPISYHSSSGLNDWTTNFWTHAFKFGDIEDAKKVAGMYKGAWIEKIIRERL